jgi:hypothetical protein
MNFPQEAVCNLVEYIQYVHVQLTKNKLERDGQLDCCHLAAVWFQRDRPARLDRSESGIIGKPMVRTIDFTILFYLLIL